MSNVLTAGKGAAFIQTQPGVVPQYLSCAEIDDVALAAGDVTPIMCRDVDGNFETVGMSRGVPGRVTTGIAVRLRPETNALDGLLKCPVTLYAQTYDCSKANDFPKAVRGVIIPNAVITGATEANIVKYEGDDARTYHLDLSGDYPWYRYRKIKAGNVGGSPDAVLVDIAMLTGQCAGACGEYKPECNDGVAIGYASGSASTPVVYITHDGGVTWTASATLPFAAGGAAEQVAALKSVVYFSMGGGVNRIVVVRGTAAAIKPAIAYSDDNGATWTIVILTGGVVAAAAVGTESMFALDKANIWLVDDSGYIHYSDDAAVTWMVLDAGVVSAAADLNGVHFADELNGTVVGPAGLVATSADGGVSWTAQTATGAGALMAVHMFNAQRIIVGGATVGLWMTFDGGTTWNVRSVVGGSGTIDDIHFLNDYIGWMVVGDDAARSVDGGYTWELYALGAFVASAVWGCDENTAFFVGATAGGDPSIVKLN